MDHCTAYRFGALLRDDSVRDGYLMSWRSITTVASMTVYAQVRVNASTRGRSSSPMSVAAFGDPRYPGAAVTVNDESRGEAAASADVPQQLGAPETVPGDAEVIDAVRSGLKLERLSATREEAQAIARLYGPSAGVVRRRRGHGGTRQAAASRHEDRALRAARDDQQQVPAELGARVYDSRERIGLRRRMVCSRHGKSSIRSGSTLIL